MSMSRRAFLGGCAAVPLAGVLPLKGQARTGAVPRVDGPASVSVWKHSVSTAVLRAARSLTGSAGSRIRMPTCRAGKCVMGLIRGGARASSGCRRQHFRLGAGREAALPPILFGSHIDWCPTAGTSTAIWVHWRPSAPSKRWQPPARKPAIHSKWWSGPRRKAWRSAAASAPAALSQETFSSDMDQVWNGMTRADAIRKIGGAPDRIMEAVRPKGAHHCYLELHIEQGGTLDRSGTPIGVVEGIVAIDRHTATVTGVANHAGTTPMPDRQDALIAASQLAWPFGTLS